MSIRSVPALAFASLFALAVVLHPGDQDPKPFPTAGERADAAALRFSIRDAAGAPIPGRLTFLDEKGAEPALFVKTDPAPGVLAVRKNVVYSLGTPVAITVPPGRWKVLASHGLEWSVAETELALESGKTQEWNPKLVHELETPGWASGDFHLHTLTYSGHGDSNMTERILSIAGEGVDFAVATDHNHNTDYRPTIAQVGAQTRMTAVTGNEVTTDIGHFNVFPLDPARAVIDSTPMDAHAVFALIRAEPPYLGAAPVIQVNHPRWYDIDYFGMKHLDPITGASSDATWSLGFDAIEVLNENAGWGYEEPYEGDRPNGHNLHSALYDWFNLLNRGERMAATGNSDSHTVHYALAGYPRNYVRVLRDDPATLDPAEIVRGVRAKSLFTTTGPLLDVRVGDASMGGTAKAEKGRVAVSIGLRAASWIDVSRIKIVVDGDTIETIPIERKTGPLEVRLQREVALPRGHDAWIVVLAEGDRSLAPIIGDQSRPILPIAIANPVWVEQYGDAGAWRSPSAWARECAETLPEEKLAEAWGWAPPADQALLLVALAEARNALAARLIPEVLALASRKMRLAAARAAEVLADAALAPALAQASERAEADEYFALAVLRARAACGGQLPALLAEFCRRYGPASFQRAPRELEDICPKDFVTEWTAIGPFASPAAGTFAKVQFGPEQDADAAKSWRTIGGDARWQPAHARADGFVALADLDGDGRPAENSIAFAQCWLSSPDERTVLCLLGTDDGARVRIGDAIVHESAERRTADPMAVAVQAKLAPGWNRVLFEVENGKGGSGFYFRVLDPEVTAAAAR